METASQSLKGLSLRIAYRYFRGKRSAQAINIISWISIGSVSLLATAMVVLMSVFNGFEDLLKDLYKAFYPEIKISATRGKWLDLNEEQFRKIAGLKGVANVSRSAEDMVLLSANDEQRIAILKGVDHNWFLVNDIDSFIFEGEKTLDAYTDNYIPAIVGNTLAGGMGLDVSNIFTGLQVYAPNPGASGSLSPESSFRSLMVKPSGRFRVQEDFDARYILVPLPEAQKLFDNQQRISAVELKLKSGADLDQVRGDIKRLLPGDNIKIEDRFQQNRTIYMIMQAEKWAGFIILIFVLVIASFTMIGVLSMLALEKKKDIAILRSMGATPRLIRGIFIFEGAIFGFTGGCIGLMLGLLLCIGQKKYGWITLGDGFIIDGYPVSVHIPDLIIVLCTTLLTGMLTAIHPARKAAAQPLHFREE